MRNLQAHALYLAIRSGQCVTLAVQGSAMYPLLRAPMVVELENFDGGRAIGSVIALELGEEIVLRRIVGRNGRCYRVCSDSYCLGAELVDLNQIIGRVRCIHTSTGSVASKTLHNQLFVLLGWLITQTHGIRTKIAIVCLNVRTTLELLGLSHRVRSFLALMAATSAAINEDCEGLTAVLRVCPASSMMNVALRHGCAAILWHAMIKCQRKTNGIEQLERGLRTYALAIEQEVKLASSQIGELVKILNQHCIDFVLLKGSARIYGDDSDASHHPSTDIDILVRPSDVERAVKTIVEHGYHYSNVEHQVSYLSYHHHAAPLKPTRGGLNVELHHALAAPGLLSEQFDWETLEAHIVKFQGPQGEARRLDSLGTALHLCIHSIGIEKLRDVVLLSSMLRKEPSLIAALGVYVEREKLEAVRLKAVVALAARLARLSGEATAEVDRYLEWVCGREELPEAMRGRVGEVETRYRSHSDQCDLNRADCFDNRPKALGSLLLHRAVYSTMGWVAPILARRLCRTGQKTLMGGPFWETRPKESEARAAND